MICRDCDLEHPKDQIANPHYCIARMDERIEKLEARLASIKALVDKQAEDDGLWFLADHAAEGYLQQELRKLHLLIEDEK
jgi:hypothetical protein